jgi:hypothetical protein
LPASSTTSPFPRFEDYVSTTTTVQPDRELAFTGAAEPVVAIVGGAALMLGVLIVGIQRWWERPFQR